VVRGIGKIRWADNFSGKYISGRFFLQRWYRRRPSARTHRFGRCCVTTLCKYKVVLTRQNGGPAHVVGSPVIIIIIHLFIIIFVSRTLVVCRWYTVEPILGRKTIAGKKNTSVDFRPPNAPEHCTPAYGFWFGDIRKRSS